MFQGNQSNLFPENAINSTDINKNSIYHFDLKSFILFLIFLILHFTILIFIIYEIKSKSKFTIKFPRILKTINIFVILNINIEFLGFQNLMYIFENKLLGSIFIPHFHIIFICYYTLKISSDISIHSLSIIFSSLLIYQFNLGYDWSKQKEGILIFILILPYVFAIYLIEKNKQIKSQNISTLQKKFDIVNDFKQNLCIGFLEIQKDLDFYLNHNFGENIKYLVKEYNLKIKEFNEITLLKIIFTNLDYRINLINGNDENKIMALVSKIRPRIETLYKEYLDIIEKSNDFKNNNDNIYEINLEIKDQKNLPLNMMNDINTIFKILFENIITQKFNKFAVKSFIGRNFEFYIRKNIYSENIEIILLENNDDAKKDHIEFDDMEKTSELIDNLNRFKLLNKNSINNKNLNNNHNATDFINENSVNQNIRFKNLNLKIKNFNQKCKSNNNLLNEKIINIQNEKIGDQVDKYPLKYISEINKPKDKNNIYDSNLPKFTSRDISNISNFKDIKKTKLIESKLITH